MLEKPLNGLRDTPKFPIDKEYLVMPRRAKNAINTLASLFETAEGSKMQFTKVIAVVVSLAAGSAVAMPVPQLSGLTGGAGSLLAPVSGLTSALPVGSLLGGLKKE
ncbi:hypothetical protein HII31_13271 [Pseudocercospora fuligena]|uniref:Uncharacterized protein n=1 Tax=Pseudocercospora fuligena TaxID=685502 RepID=A0A8H6R5B1_9PEZI|nr:hypothetical protein HII31_13271 [Pseudocercospora fuligena]